MFLHRYCLVQKFAVNFIYIGSEGKGSVPPLVMPMPNIVALHNSITASESLKVHAAKMAAAYLDLTLRHAQCVRQSRPLGTGQVLRLFKRLLEREDLMT